MHPGDLPLFHPTEDLERFKNKILKFCLRTKFKNKNY